MLIAPASQPASHVSQPSRDPNSTRSTHSSSTELQLQFNAVAVEGAATVPEAATIETGAAVDSKGIKRVSRILLTGVAPTTQSLVNREVQ